MFKKSIVIFIVSLLVMGSFTGFVYGEEQSTSISEDTKSHCDEMIKVLKKNGYKELSKSLQKKDYKPLTKLKNELTDEDYSNIINILKENGYEKMANMIQKKDIDQFVKMHISMCGDKGCYIND